MTFGNGTVRIDWRDGLVAGLRYRERTLMSRPQPIFTLGLRDAAGQPVRLCSTEADVSPAGEGATYAFAGKATVSVSAAAEGERLVWRARVSAEPPFVPEYLDFPGLRIDGPLAENGGDARVLWPYNEGAIISDGDRKPDMEEPLYPSKGNYAMFPYMLGSQFLAYLFGGDGLYLGVEDERRGPKGLDFRCDAEGTDFRIRLFLGGLRETPPVVWRFFRGDWMNAADLYRDWFEKNRPVGLRPVADNPALPAWYREMPVVLTYPVRGIHDMDRMEPNKLFPYGNALPLADSFAERMDSRLLVVLMHWEGTAPWAPPYVWPPYGGEEALLEFMRDLHDRGHLLGVYCSGLGWTEQSNLIERYNTETRFRDEHLEEAMCRAPDGSLPHSRICTFQRRGYDICPVSAKGKSILRDALRPLFGAHLDYMQVMDQNHGGSMYFCYATDHGHPAVPGPWMTEAMQRTTAAWQAACPNGLLGCESAAAEPYLGTLLLSDNRYELNYFTGRAVPLHAYLYHRYVHNFMGNQVCAPFAYDTLGICYRLAYSFAAGDLLTLVLNDDGEIMFHWGMRDFSRHSDKDAILAFCRKLHRMQKAYPQFLACGQMEKPLPHACATTKLALTGPRKELVEPSVLSAAYRDDEGHGMQFFVNYTDAPVPVTVAGETFTVPPLDVVVRPLVSR